jgi:hypothetical protein
MQELSIRHPGQRLRRDKPEIVDLAIDVASPVNADFWRRHRVSPQFAGFKTQLGRFLSGFVPISP